MAKTDTISTGGAAPKWDWPSWIKGFKEDYQEALVEPWSPYLGGVLLAVAAAVLMAVGWGFGVFGGLKLWGDYVNTFLGLGPALGIPETLPNPLMHRTSLLVIVLVLGAFSAALMSRQFRINRPPPLEYVWGAVGGTLMGIGAALAGGCTVGGFFTPVMFASPTGWTMLAGLLAGAYIGLRVLLWILDHFTWGTVAPPVGSDSPLKPYYPWFGLAVIVLVLIWATGWFVSPDQKLVARGAILVVGFAIGFVIHRSRFCFARVIREPFMTGEGTQTKAMILTLALGMALGAILLGHKTVDPYMVIPTTFWMGSLIGGVIFGIGMVLAGGCATGSLWRLAEGHLKLLVTAFFFGWTGSIASGVLKGLGLTKVDLDIDFLDGIPEITGLGFQAFLPDLLQGWGSVFVIGFAILAVWYLFVRYNESTERFTVL